MVVPPPPLVMPLLPELGDAMAFVTIPMSLLTELRRLLGRIRLL